MNVFQIPNKAEFQNMYFYYFSHFLQVWILPPGLNLILIVIGYYYSQYSRRIGKMIIIVSFISLWLFCTPIVAQWLIDGLQYQYPKSQINRIVKNNKTSAIIVLGGGQKISYNDKIGYVLTDDSERRLHYAAYLYYHTHLSIIVSGGTVNSFAPSEAELMHQELKNYFHIPVAWKEEKSVNTRDEANFVLPVLQKNNIKIAYLVTNAWHMPRTMYIFHHAFKHANIKIIAAPMGYNISQLRHSILNYLPSCEGLINSVIAMHEYIGMLAYHLDNFDTYVLSFLKNNQLIHP